MKTADLVVCCSLLGVSAEPTHDFNICVMSEGSKKGIKKETLFNCGVKQLFIYTADSYSQPNKSSKFVRC